jgi:hypothetical protein
LKAEAAVEEGIYYGKVGNKKASLGVYLKLYQEM